NSYVATMTITNSTLSGNSGNYGGAIYNGGALTITNCTLSGNTALYGYGGGGVYSDNGTTMTITNSTLSGNTANYGYGGGIFNDYATMTVGSTILNVGGGSGDNIFN